MENTPLNKVKFFSQYWGQKVFVNPILSSIAVNNIFLYNYAEPEHIEEEYLELKNLSSITDDEALKLSQLRYSIGEYITISNGKCMVSCNENQVGLMQTQVDYLRNNGYALPWMELSVEKLIEYGWIKLI